MQTRTPRQSSLNAWTAAAFVCAAVAVAIAVSLALGWLPDRWGTVGGQLGVLALALSVAGRCSPRSLLEKRAAVKADARR